jgi:hypothetical protein
VQAYTLLAYGICVTLATVSVASVALVATIVVCCTVMLNVVSTITCTLEGYDSDDSEAALTQRT